MPIPILALIELRPESLAAIESAGYTVHTVADPKGRADLHRNDIVAEVRAVLTNGSTGLDANEIAMLKKLEIICAMGAGYENVDLAAAKARGIVVTNGRGTNDVSVADHAMAILLSLVRDVPQADAAVRRGEWSRSRAIRPIVSGKKLGILGIGFIGKQIARRGAAGFDMEIGYHSRHRREDLAYRYFDTPVALAAWCDFLVVATPGGDATRHLVNRSVLVALGSNGYLVNIARGSVVDTAALIDALSEKRIAGAALDVVEGEPNVPEALLRLENAVLTPHIAGRSPESIRAMAKLFIGNLDAHFAGRPVLTPIT